VHRLGAGEHCDSVGIHPRPVQQPVPIWLAAGFTERALKRVGRLADGWLPRGGPGAELDDSLAIIAKAAVAAGREPTDIGLEGRIDVGPANIDSAADRAVTWAHSGATHISFNIMGQGLRDVEDTLTLLAEVKAELDAHMHG
jgi:alkanesulfonate monooxygenase SsuD/methylene tetrahydromethanopterin reductase-like flavin-dependent oxidoreductase (luciferase family)